MELGNSGQTKGCTALDLWSMKAWSCSRNEGFGLTCREVC